MDTFRAGDERNRDENGPAAETGERDDAEEHEEELLDEALEDSFPASDPPSRTQPPPHLEPTDDDEPSPHPRAPGGR